jgi:hypothetical protein
LKRKSVRSSDASRLGIIRYPRPSEYPEKIEVLPGVFYHISFHKVILRDRNCHGSCNDTNRRIRLRLGQSNRALLETFVHELLHAIEFELKLKIPHKSLDEVATALVRVLALNF